MAKKSVGKKEEQMAAEPKALKAPKPPEPSDSRLFSVPDLSMKNINLKLSLRSIMVLILIVMMISGIVFFTTTKLRQKEALEKKMLGFEKDANGTQIAATRQAILDMISSGERPVPKEEALSGSSDDYICTITTQKGFITLKKKGDLMREEVVREGYNLSVIFIGEKFYMYHPLYNVWAMFDYDPQERTYDNVIREMAFSMKDLKEINQTSYACIKTSLPQEEFSLGDAEIVDAVEYLETSNRPFG